MWLRVEGSQVLAIRFQGLRCLRRSCWPWEVGISGFPVCRFFFSSAAGIDEVWAVIGFYRSMEEQRTLETKKDKSSRARRADPRMASPSRWRCIPASEVSAVPPGEFGSRAFVSLVRQEGRRTSSCMEAHSPFVDHDSCLWLFGAFSLKAATCTSPVFFLPSPRLILHNQGSACFSPLHLYPRVFPPDSTGLRAICNPQPIPQTLQSAQEPLSLPARLRQ